jgi:hypothetical protein
MHNQIRADRLHITCIRKYEEVKPVALRNVLCTETEPGFFQLERSPIYSRVEAEVTPRLILTRDTFPKTLNQHLHYPVKR